MEKELDHFSIKQTNIAKGIALLLLLWHHLFYNNPNNYNDFKSLYVFNGKPIECILADFCKVCVAMFLILSGYGLYKIYTSYIEKQMNQKGVNRLKNSVIYTKNRLIKLISDYWFIYIIFVCIINLSICLKFIYITSIITKNVIFIFYISFTQ